MKARLGMSGSNFLLVLQRRWRWQFRKKRKEESTCDCRWRQRQLYLTLPQPATVACKTEAAVGTRARCTRTFFARPAPTLHVQSVLSDKKISASELGRMFVKSALRCRLGVHNNGISSSLLTPHFLTRLFSLLLSLFSPLPWGKRGEIRDAACSSSSSSSSSSASSSKFCAEYRCLYV